LGVGVLVVRVGFWGGTWMKSSVLWARILLGTSGSSVRTYYPVNLFFGPKQIGIFFQIFFWKV
jgi:hypothetical protein